jgi:hypothetical protein
VGVQREFWKRRSIKNKNGDTTHTKPSRRCVLTEDKLGSWERVIFTKIYDIFWKSKFEKKLGHSSQITDLGPSDSNSLRISHLWLCLQQVEVAFASSGLSLRSTCRCSCSCYCQRRVNAVVVSNRTSHIDTRAALSLPIFLTLEIRIVFRYFLPDLLSSETHS